MARPPSKHPTDGELELLHILWQQQPVSLGDICSTIRESRTAATTTVATMLRIMHDKGLVERIGSGRTAQWQAMVSREQATESMVGKLVDGLFSGSAERLVAHLVESKSLSHQDIAELRSLLDSADKSSADTKPRRKGTQK